MKRHSKLAELAADNRDGAAWYDNAAGEIAEVCLLYNWSVDRFAGVLSVTSPRVIVRRNVRITLHYLHTGELFANVMRGIRKSVEQFEACGVIKGPKTSAFRDAILGDQVAIVLDVHMADLFGVPQSTLATIRGRKPIEDTIRRVAKRVGMSPRDCQAALWAGQLKRRGRKPTPLCVRQEALNQRALGGFNDGGAIPQLAQADGSYQRELCYG